MLHDAVLSASRLPMLFRGDVMRQSSFGLIALVLVPMLLILALKVRSGMRIDTACLWMGLGVYAAWAAGLLFDPGARAEDPRFAGEVWRWINLVPFATIAEQVRTMSGSALVQLIGNIGLLLPLGLVGPHVMPSLRRFQRLALVALGGTVAIEIVQMVGTTLRLIDRSVDVDDVILNVTGALLGWLMWRAVASIRANERGERETR